jgi:hypothetical protein
MAGGYRVIRHPANAMNACMPCRENMAIVSDWHRMRWCNDGRNL